MTIAELQNTFSLNVSLTSLVPVLCYRLLNCFRGNLKKKNQQQQTIQAQYRTFLH